MINVILMVSDVCSYYLKKGVLYVKYQLLAIELLRAKRKHHMLGVLKDESRKYSVARHQVNVEIKKMG